MGRVMGCGLCPYNAIEKVGNYETGTVEGEADMETVSCAFSLLCLILYMSG